MIEWFCTDEADRILGTHKTYDTWKEGFLDLYNYLHANKAIIMNAYHSNFRNYLEKYIRSLVHPYIVEFLNIQREGIIISNEKLEFIADTYTYGIVSIAMDWIANDMAERYNKSMDFFLRLLDGSMKHTLQKFSEQ